MSELHRITVDSGQCGGRPCIRGLRVRVKDILDLLAAGASRDEILADHPTYYESFDVREILADYPFLESEDITAALEFAARQGDPPDAPAPGSA